MAEAAQIGGERGGNVEANWPVVYAAMREWGLATPLTCLGVIGTIAVESAGTFAPIEEAFWLSPAAREAFYADTTKHAAYAGGTRYHGRGFIQTTHLGNYKRVEDACAAKGHLHDLVDHPELLLDPRVSAEALCVFWFQNGLQAVCEQQDWAEVRRRVFGGADPEGTKRIKFAADKLIPLAKQRGFL